MAENIPIKWLQDESENRFFPVTHLHAVRDENDRDLTQILNNLPDNLSELGDTNISNPTNGQILKYNSVTSKWENSNDSGGGSADWDAPENTSGHVLNRTHYRETVDGDYIVDEDIEVRYTGASNSTGSLIGNLFGYIDPKKNYEVEILVTGYGSKRYNCLSPVEARIPQSSTGRVWSLFGFSDNQTNPYVVYPQEFCAIDITEPIDNDEDEFITHFDISINNAVFNITGLAEDTDISCKIRIREVVFNESLYDFCNAGGSVSDMGNGYLMFTSNSKNIHLENMAYNIICQDIEVDDTYPLKNYEAEEIGYIGNIYLANQTMEDTGEQFFFAAMSGICVLILPDSVEYQDELSSTIFSIYPTETYKYHKLDPIYIPISDLPFIKSNDYEFFDHHATSGTTTITFSKNKKTAHYMEAANDISFQFIVYNSADNYIWVKNGSSNPIDISLPNTVLYKAQSDLTISIISTPDWPITVDPGKYAEISIICNSKGAFITKLNNLENLTT